MTEQNDKSKFEEWRAVVGFEGLYEVSDRGRVKRVGRAARHGKSHGGGARIGRILKLQTNWAGYQLASLWKSGQYKFTLVHRLVMAAFAGPIPEGKECNHKDGVKANNSLSNLEYVTRSENNKHAYKLGLMGDKPYRKGTEHHSAKLTDAKVREMRRLYATGVGSTTLGRLFGVNTATAYNITHGKLWKHVT